MTPDPVLEGLIAAGAFAIAADRYEEESGDTELAALMRIPGLEWQLVGDVPAMKFVGTFIDGERWGWWELMCGSHDFGTEPLLNRFAPPPVEQSLVPALLQKLGFGNDLAPRLYRLYREAIERVCVL